MDEPKWKLSWLQWSSHDIMTSRYVLETCWSFWVRILEIYNFDSLQMS